MDGSEEPFSMINPVLENRPHEECTSVVECDEGYRQRRLK